MVWCQLISVCSFNHFFVSQTDCIELIAGFHGADINNSKALVWEYNFLSGTMRWAVETYKILNNYFTYIYLKAVRLLSMHLNILSAIQKQKREVIDFLVIALTMFKKHTWSKSMPNCLLITTFASHSTQNHSIYTKLCFYSSCNILILEY